MPEPGLRPGERAWQAAPALGNVSAVEGNSFPRKARLLQPADFQRVFERAVSSSDRLFKVFARPGKAPWSRLGLAVSRRVDPRASARNRIKRLVRESFRLEHSSGAARDEHRPSRDYVVVALPPATAAPNARLAKSLGRHWREVDRKLEAAAGMDVGRQGSIDE